MFVVTIDQRDSRGGGDRVPELLASLDGAGTLAGFERTVGDEVQALFDDAEALVAAVRGVVREGGWHVGIGVGDVEEVPGTVREGRGAAFVAARQAVDAAKKTAESVAVRGAGGALGTRGAGLREAGAREGGAPEAGARKVSARDAGARKVSARDAGARGAGTREAGARAAGVWAADIREASIRAADVLCRLVASIVAERTGPQREVVAAFEGGARGREVAADLQVTPQAVSQRRTAARLDLELSGWQAVAQLLREVDCSGEEGR